jgi:predicted AlkP superfamily pyrophosphatase or phosphodiesterase
MPVTLVSGSIGQHGYISTNPKMNAAFIASGRGIRRGTKLGLIENTSVAPTIMRLLGQPLPESSGKVLGEMLSAE